MDREHREKEFNELESRARYRLSHPEKLEPSDTIRHLQAAYRFWHYPSFGDHKSWLLFLPAHNLNDTKFTIAREVTWKRPFDAERFINPVFGLQRGFHLEPSLEIIDAIVSLKDLNEELEKLDKIQISIGSKSKTAGLDGEIYGFQDFDSFRGIRLEWWCGGPPEWTELTSWAAGMREFLESHFRPWEETDAWRIVKPLWT